MSNSIPGRRHLARMVLPLTTVALALAVAPASAPAAGASAPDLSAAAVSPSTINCTSTGWHDLELAFAQTPLGASPLMTQNGTWSPFLGGEEFDCVNPKTSGTVLDRSWLEVSGTFSGTGIDCDLAWEGATVGGTLVGSGTFYLPQPFGAVTVHSLTSTLNGGEMTIVGSGVTDDGHNASIHGHAASTLAGSACYPTSSGKYYTRYTQWTTLNVNVTA